MGMGWLFWCLVALVGICLFLVIANFINARTSVDQMGLTVDLLISGSWDLELVTIRHKYSDKSISLHRSGIGADRQITLEVDGNICTEDEFTRIQQVLWDHDIEFDVIEDENGSRISIDTKLDITRATMAAQYIFMDSFHLPFDAKLRIKTVYKVTS